MWHRQISDRDAGFWRFYAETRLFCCRRFDCARERRAAILAALGVERPLLVTDAGVAALPWFDALGGSGAWQRALLGRDGAIAPIRAAIAAGAGCDGVVAIGGGSVLDAAKLVAAALGSGIAPEALGERQQLPRPPLPLLAVPTTFGTGSEVNLYSHLDTGAGKRGLRRSWLAPAAALLVAEIALASPPPLRFLGALDAWSHAFEARSLIREQSPPQRFLLDAALRSIECAFERYVTAPDLETAETMATAAALAGIGLNNGRTALAHTLAVPFAARIGLPHAESLLPFLLPAALFNGGEREAGPVQFIREILLPRARPFLARWNFQVGQAEIEALADACLEDTVLLKESPRALDRDTYLRLYREALAPWTRP